MTYPQFYNSFLSLLQNDSRMGEIHSQSLAIVKEAKARSFGNNLSLCNIAWNMLPNSLCLKWLDSELDFFGSGVLSEKAIQIRICFILYVN